MTALDAIGPYEVLSRLPGAEVDVRRRAAAGRCATDTGAPGLVADGRSRRRAGARHGRWSRAVPQRRPTPAARSTTGCAPSTPTSTWTTSVCTGSLILAAAGLLDGRRATSHWLALDQLTAYGPMPTAERVVIDGKYATAAGVSAGIDWR